MQSVRHINNNDVMKLFGEILRKYHTLMGMLPVPSEYITFLDEF